MSPISRLITSTERFPGAAAAEIFDSLVEGVAILTRNLEITYINQNARFLMQLAGDPPDGVPMASLVPQAIADALEKPLRQALRGEAILAHEMVSRFPEGAEVSLGIAVFPIPPHSPRPESLLITMRDLSVSREVSRLQDIAQAKEEFFSTLSHELRTPLTSIIAYADTLLAGISSSVEETAEFIGVIKSEGERLSRMIDEVLDLARMEANRFTLHLKDVDLREVIRSSAQGMAAAAQQSGHRLELALGGQPLHVSADPERLHQVLTNLLGNALKFTPAGGAITVGACERGHRVETWVSDTGIGISSEDLPRIFEKFERIERPGMPVKGSGLGLPITKGLVERMGGRIWAQSSPGLGTTVRFTLPRPGADPHPEV